MRGCQQFPTFDDLKSPALAFALAAGRLSRADGSGAAAAAQKLEGRLYEGAE